MGNTLYTILLFGVPLLVCIILWKIIAALIDRFWPRAAAVERPGCLNLLVFFALGALYFGMLNLVNSNFVTITTVSRNAKGKVVHKRSHVFAPGKKINGEAVPENTLVNESDIPVYIYSETYGEYNPIYTATGLPTYAVMCGPGQSVPVLMHIDYYFKRAPQKVHVKDREQTQIRWVIDTVIPYDYVIPVAPNAPVITSEAGQEAAQL